MDYFTDFTMLCLTPGLVLGGLALGQRVGAFAAAWGAGGAWLALRFADRMWRTVFTEMREADAGVDAEFWLPMSYGLLFAGLFAGVLAWIVWVKPRPDELRLPGKAGAIMALTSGACAGALVLLAIAQSQVMSASAEERMPQALQIARPVLEAIGQEHVAMPTQAAGVAR